LRVPLSYVVRHLRESFKMTEEADDFETGDILIRRMHYPDIEASMPRAKAA
jgi:DNA-binding ferritin-like protein